MEEITGEEFEARLCGTEDVLSDLNVTFERSCAINLNRVNSRMTLKNVNLNGKSLRFFSSNIQLQTINLNLIESTFENEVCFENCSILKLNLSNVVFKNEKLILKYCTLMNFGLKNVLLLKKNF